jgi:hypothetical protein
VWRRWDNGGRKFIDPHIMIFKRVEGIVEHWRASTFGGMLFPMLHFFIFFPYLLGLN